MRKTIVLIIVGLMMSGICGSSWAGVTATDVVCTGCVNDTDIATGAVTNTKIADGAVTNAKITGPISAAKIEKSANVVVVAKSGGDYTSVTAALAAINPTVDNPYVIKVMPGIYTEGSITMKSYVHLEGAGREITTIDTQEGYVNVSSTDDVAVSSLTIIGQTPIQCWNGCNDLRVSGNILIKAGGGSAEGVALYDTISGSQFITDNIITGGFAQGIDIYYSGSPMIRNNIVKGNQTGIWLQNSVNPTVIGNDITENQDGIRVMPGGAATISGNSITNNTNTGIYGSGNAFVTGNTIKGNGGIGVKTAATITGNTIVNNSTGIHAEATGTITGNTISGNSVYGVQMHANSPTSVVTLSNNRVVNSGSFDVFTNNNYGLASISLNVYDTFTGSGAVGAYNVKSDGTPAPLQ